jgi:hypothetical protein
VPLSPDSTSTGNIHPVVKRLVFDFLSDMVAGDPVGNREWCGSIAAASCPEYLHPGDVGQRRHDNSSTFH